MSGVVVYVEFNNEGRKYFDESLAEAGTLLLGLAEHEIREHGPSIGAELMRAESQHNAHEIAFQIWTEDHRAAYRTNSAPGTPVHAARCDRFWLVHRERAGDAHVRDLERLAHAADPDRGAA